MKSNTKKFLIFLGLLGLDLIIPDPIPILDEAILAILTGYFGIKSLENKK